MAHEGVRGGGAEEVHDISCEREWMGREEKRSEYRGCKR